MAPWSILFAGGCHTQVDGGFEVLISSGNNCYSQPSLSRALLGCVLREWEQGKFVGYLGTGLWLRGCLIMAEEGLDLLLLAPDSKARPA